ncbi:choice-of-anchor D domain-containing protein [Vulgatibacter sp.]|uniref:choice-of-anchor D domain-containing protein n=1 Tax=Vulgatibacter sp. TaxID=1971226 RepID=UPI0035655860
MGGRQILLGTLLPFLATACGCEPRQPAPAEQNAPAALAIEPALADPAGEADAAVFFGPVQVGQSRAETVLVRNVGGAATEVELGSVEPPFSLAAYGSAQLAPGDALELELRFTPEEARGDESILTLAAGGERISIRLAGSGTPAPPGSCVLHVATRTLRWFGVGVGYEAVREPYLSNTGAAPCEVSLAVEGDGFSVESGAVTVPPHEAIPLPVRWTPAATGTTTGLLEVRHGEESWSVPLEGEAVASCLVLSTGVLDFGAVAPGCAVEERDIRLTNRCSHPASFRFVEVASSTYACESMDGVGACDEFAIRQRPHLGEPIAGGASVTLVYMPGDRGADAGRFLLTEGNGAVHAVDLVGSGAPQQLQTDTFVQDPLPRVDQLFVIDDGPAMASALPVVEDFMADYAAFARQQRLLGRIGVTTTSRIATAGCAGSGADGRLLPVDGSAPRWLDTQTADPTTLADLLAIEPCSAAPNEGLAAAWRALSVLVDEADDPAHPEADDGNAGFLRDQANLSIVFVSAADDASGEDVLTWAERFFSIKGFRNSNMLSAHAIVPGEACGTTLEENRYAEIAERTNGVAGDLCAPASWPTSLFRIGTNAWEFTTRFHLTQVPQDHDLDGDVQDDIEVRIDGTVVARVTDDGATRWRWREAGNRIEFVLGHEPPEGALLQVTYRVECL